MSDENQDYKPFSQFNTSNGNVIDPDIIKTALINMREYDKDAVVLTTEEFVSLLESHCNATELIERTYSDDED